MTKSLFEEIEISIYYEEEEAGLVDLDVRVACDTIVEDVIAYAERLVGLRLGKGWYVG